MFSAIRSIFKNYPLTRGVAAYACIWPISSCIQQKLAGKQIDYGRAARFCLYGSLYVALPLYV